MQALKLKLILLDAAIANAESLEAAFELQLERDETLSLILTHQT